MHYNYIGRRGITAVLTSLVLSMGSIMVSADEPEKRTKEEIMMFYEEHPYDTKSEITFEEEPSFSPYTAGKLSEGIVNDGLNAWNFVRYIAGVPADITINPEYEEMAQTGCVVLAKNNVLSHQPDNTYDIPKEFFEKGYSGVSQSNLGRGYINISSSILNGYMNDGDSSNIDKVGHRRWCLYPGIRYTGFGYYNRYTALYIFDESRTDYEMVDYIAWPAQTMPYEVFRGPWSVQLSDAYKIGNNVIQVTMTDLGTGEEWIFHSNNTYDTSKTPYFNVDTENYGWMPAIIFKPDKEFSSTDKVHVKITGLTDKNGNAAEIEYTVEFFSLEDDFLNGSDGWEQQSDGKWKYKNLYGSYITDKWICINDKWYLMGIDGYMSTDWIFRDGEWYYLNTNGEMETGWKFINNKWYHFNDSGEMETGWIVSDGKWYYLNPGSGDMATGWKQINGKWYYLDAINGNCFMNTVTPDGRQVDSTGALVK